MLIAGSTMICLGIVAALIFTSAGDSTSAEADHAPAVATASPAVAVTSTSSPSSAPRPSTSTAAAAAPSAHPTPAERALPTAAASTSTSAPSTAAETPPPVAAAPARRAIKKPAAKRLVVEYGGRAGDNETPGLVAQAAEDPAIGRARAAYLAGNARLFAGDTDGAIQSYRESLRLYPGYVGGYRGLGLAYAQRGDRKQALEAFRTYVTTVPGARDIELIKKRIVRLQQPDARIPL